MFYLKYKNLSKDLIWLWWYLIWQTKQWKFSGQNRKISIQSFDTQVTSGERLYDELDLHSLVKRRWRNKLVFFYKIVNHLVPDYFCSCLNFSSQEKLSTKIIIISIIRLVPTRTKSFKRTFFPYCINKWNKVRVGIMNAKLINIFKKSIVSNNNNNKKIIILYLWFTQCKTPYGF